MIFGMIPLLMAAGPGSVSRFDIGLVIAMGLGIGTLFTLFMLPVIYTMRARNLVLFLISVCVVAYAAYTFTF
jgi:multidrug efflux pump